MDRSILKETHLVADSKYQAFYSLFLESQNTDPAVYVVRKISGAKGRVLDQREWPKCDLPEAEQLYRKKLLEKTNPNRKSLRKYVIEAGQQLPLKRISTAPSITRG